MHTQRIWQLPGLTYPIDEPKVVSLWSSEDIKHEKIWINCNISQAQGMGQRVR